MLDILKLFLALHGQKCGVAASRDVRKYVINSAPLHPPTDLFSSVG